MVGPYLLFLLDAGIALQGLITQVEDTGLIKPLWRAVVASGASKSSTTPLRPALRPAPQKSLPLWSVAEDIS